MASYSAQYDELWASTPLDARRRLPKPSMEAQAREPGAKLVPLSHVWALPKLNNWAGREPWSLVDLAVRGLAALESPLRAFWAQLGAIQFGWRLRTARWHS